MLLPFSLHSQYHIAGAGSGKTFQHTSFGRSSTFQAGYFLQLDYVAFKAIVAIEPYTNSGSRQSLGGAIGLTSTVRKPLSIHVMIGGIGIMTSSKNPLQTAGANSYPNVNTLLVNSGVFYSPFKKHGWLIGLDVYGWQQPLQASLHRQAALSLVLSVNYRLPVLSNRLHHS